MLRTPSLVRAATLTLALVAAPAWAEAPGKTYRNSLGMDFVLIPAGSLTMGRNPDLEEGDGDELPAHQVTIAAPFYMQASEVTQEQWKAVMDANPSKFKGGNNPVEGVSWDDIPAFLKALNDRDGCNGCYRLPTEAEWEYAYRAGTKTAYYWGTNAADLDQYAWNGSNSYDKTHPVGRLQPNAWGLYDMVGNVWEWVQDCYHANYVGAPADGTAWAGGCDMSSDGTMSRILRGGSWLGFPSYFRAADRNNLTSDTRNDNSGFRVVRGVSAARTFDLSADALFAFDKAVLLPQGVATINRFAGELHNVHYDSLRVSGHTDPLGSDAYNQNLSERRARAVKSQLVAQGVPADRISAQGFGESRLKVTPAECAGAKGHAALLGCYQPNRRVSITVEGMAIKD
jgi:formylglycine-generating enzyme required for sulfatase activity